MRALTLAWRVLVGLAVFPLVWVALAVVIAVDAVAAWLRDGRPWR